MVPAGWAVGRLLDDPPLALFGRLQPVDGPPAPEAEPEEPERAADEGLGVVAVDVGDTFAAALLAFLRLRGAVANVVRSDGDIVLAGFVRLVALLVRDHVHEPEEQRQKTLLRKFGSHSLFTDILW